MAQTIYFGYEQTVPYNPQVSETSACTNATSAQLIPTIVASHPGTIVDCYVALAQTAVSASGFVSGTATANVRINSATCLSVTPAIGFASASAANNRSRSNNSTTSLGVVTSAVVNTASASFVKGDMITVDYGFLSAGSAAATQGAAGISVGVVLRYNAV